MVTMQLLYNEREQALLITAAERKRLTAAAKAGEVLVYESDLGRILIADGTLTATGFDTLPALFAMRGKSYSGRPCINYQAEDAAPLKRLVKRAVVGDGTRVLCRSFIEFEALCEVVLPDSITEMENVFTACEALKPYPLPAGLQIVRGTLFGKAPDEIVLPAGVREISDASFEPYYNHFEPFSGLPIKRLVLPAALAEIPSHAFAFCRQLTHLDIPEGTESIYSSAFSGCTALVSVTLPHSVRYIGDYAFSGCTALTDVRFAAEEEVAIGRLAFRGAPCDKEMQAVRVAAAKRVAYTPDMGEIKALPTLRRVLAGKPLAAQFAHFSIVEETSTESLSYGELDAAHTYDREAPFPNGEVDAPILLDGVLVGAVIDGKPFLAGTHVCTYAATEEDGTGTRSRYDYCGIVFKESI